MRCRLALLHAFARVVGIILRGAVDEILDKNGTLIVLDFKTRGFPTKEDTAEFYRDQIDIYNVANSVSNRKLACPFILSGWKKRR